MSSDGHRTTDFRGISLGVLATIAVVFALKVAAPVFIPLCFGVMLSYTLSPIVNRMARWRIPRALGAAVVMLAVLGGTAALGNSLRDDATALIDSLPEAAQRLRVALQRPRQTPDSPIESMQKAATEIERAAEESAAAAPPTRPGVQRVVIEQPRFNVKDYLWSGTLGLLELLGQITMAILIAYFLLVSGDAFRRKLLSVVGTRLSHKRLTLDMLEEINAQIRGYLIVQLITSAILGVAVWLSFLWIGLDHAAVWGLVGGVTNLIPYVGSLILGVGSAAFAFMQFNQIDMALLVGGSTVVIHMIVGNLLTPWMTSRAGNLNAVSIFVGLLAWGWLWGVWGLLLGIPILMVVKAVCDRVDELHPIGELLGT